MNIEKIKLRKIKSSDDKYFSIWWRDKTLIKLTSGDLKPITDAEVKKYFLAMLRSRKDYHFMIILDKQVIGHISLVKRKDKWHETQIVIGEKSCWNKGCGTKAIQMLLKKAKRFSISKIFLEVRPNNLRAIKSYKKCGFVKIEIKKYSKNKHLPEVLRMELEDKFVK